MTSPDGPSGRSGPFSLVGREHPDLAPRPDDLAEAMTQVRAALPGGGPDRAGDPVEVAREQVLAFCRAHPDALHRSCLSGHLTGSALVVDRRGDRTLLLHHAKLDRWLQPGGHADGDGNLAHVAWREATEETGLVGLQVVVPAIDIDVHRIPARPGEPEHDHLDLRFVVVASDDTVALNHESLGARWVGPVDPVVADAPDLARAVERALAVVRALS